MFTQLTDVFPVKDLQQGGLSPCPSATIFNKNNSKQVFKKKYLVFNRVTKFFLTNHIDCIRRPSICVIIKCTHHATSDVYSADRIAPS